MDFPDLVSAQKYLASLTRHGIHPDLDSVSRVLSRLGHPQSSYPAIQITGTNGKGSTSVILDAIFRQAGYRTGLYTSPHLLDLRERIRTGGNLVGADQFLHSLGEVCRVQKDLGVTLTFFETLTAVSFLVFRLAAIELAILEVGMGGRWDATSVCTPSVSVLTSLAKDHTEILGDTLEKILGEKAAIGRKGKPFVANVPPECLLEWSQHESRIGFVSVLYGRDFKGKWEGVERKGLRRFSYAGGPLSGTYQTSLTAEYQIRNLLSAMAVLEKSPWTISPQSIGKALENVSHPGRWEKVPGINVYLDGAHNPEAAHHLVEQIGNMSRSRKQVGFLAGFLNGKDWESIIKILAGAGNQFFLVSPPGADGVDPVRIRDSMLKHQPDIVVFQGPFDAMCRSAFDWVASDPDRLLVVTGSLYLVGAVRKWHSGDDSPLSAGERSTASLQS